MYFNVESDEMKAKPLISVIITTKNEEGVIRDLLESVKKQTYKKWEVIVVDNSSLDNTQKIAREYTKKVYTKGPERSAQRNYGVEKAKGDCVVILDADQQLAPTTLQECVGEFKNDPKVGALVIPEKSFGRGFWTQFKVFEREFYVGEKDIEAARVFSRDLFDKFGGYDLSITGPEDWDLPLRMRKAGIKIGRTRSFVLHNERTFNPWRSAKKKFYYASGAGVYWKRYPEKMISHGNLLFRSVFFRKWKKLVDHPVLAIGMFAIRALEMTGAGLGFLYGLTFKGR